MSGRGAASTAVAYAPERRRAVWDIVLSIVFLLGNGVAYFFGGVTAIFVMAFTDYCPPGCDIEAGVTAVFSFGIAITIVGVAATILTIVLLVTRRRAWWVPLLAGILTCAGWLIAFAIYTDAVSAS